ncbi:hypothetical protein [Bradyrhizobium sp.]
MLARNFKSAADLGITEPQLDALRKVLVLLETGRLRHVPAHKLRGSMDEPRFAGLFNMWYSFADSECGSVGCIRGSAMMISGVDFPAGRDNPDGLHELFYNWSGGDPNDQQAAAALRSYLTTGDARWDLAVA